MCDPGLILISLGKMYFFSTESPFAFKIEFCLKTNSYKEIIIRKENAV